MRVVRFAGICVLLSLLPRSAAAAAPAAPVLTYPTNGATGVQQWVSLGWNPTVGAQSYDVYLGATPDPPFAGNVTYTSFYPPQQLKLATTYYWRIVAKDATSSTSSATWSFSTVRGDEPPQYPPYVFSITNSASYAVSGQDGYGIAPGSIFVLFGANLGPIALQQAGAFPLPLKLGTTEIEITVGSTTVKAPIVYSFESQVAALLPSSTPVGEGTLSLRTERFAARPVPIRVQKTAVGLYAASGNGIGAGTITDAAYRLKTYSEPARPGDILILWATGLGAVEGDENSVPLPGNRFGDVEVFAGGARAEVIYGGRSGCCAGLDQIVVRLPATVAGCFVPVAVSYGGVTSNFVTIPVAPPGQACHEAVGISDSLLATAASGGAVRIGAIALGPMPILHGAGFSPYRAAANRLSSLLKTPVPEAEIKALARSSGVERSRRLKAAIGKYGPRLKAADVKPRDVVRAVGSLDDQAIGAGFMKLTGLSALTSLFGSMLPPPGSCTIVRHWPFQSRDWGAMSTAQDAGAQLAFVGPLGNHPVPRVETGEYQAALGSSAGRMPAGIYTVSAAGGPDVGAFDATLRVDGIQWTNKDDVSTVDRTRPLRITWAGISQTGYVLVGGASSESEDKSAFACVAPASDRELTVPAHVLSAIPKTDKGWLFLSAHPFQNTFRAEGIDYGYFVDLDSERRDVLFH